MRDNCVIFTTPERQELRVVFDPDGTPFFCGPDLAAIAGYEQPRKAVTGGNQGVNRIESVLRKVPWDNGMRRGRCDFTCFSAENAVKLLCRRPAPYAAIRWLEDATLIVKGKKTLDQVPALIRKQVEEILKDLEVEVE